MNPDFGKNSYESIPIPEKLNEIVAQTIASRNKEEIHMSYENTNTTYKTKNPRKPKFPGEFFIPVVSDIQEYNRSDRRRRRSKPGSEGASEARPSVREQGGFVKLHTSYRHLLCLAD